MKQAFFITGTDTGIGKTYIACKLIKQYVAQGYKVVGMKPVAAGCDWVNGEWINDDVLKLEAASNIKVPRELTNPYSFKEAIAPHIAADLEGKTIEITIIKQAFDELCKLADIVIVEGAGGFLVPLNNSNDIADLAKALNIPIIVVVGIKLGCINHALLTIESIKARNCPIKGWVANLIDSQMQCASDNIASIEKKLYSINRINI
ncbi:BioD Dethiobiotin synthetase [Methylophilaceae bacterium]